METVDKLALLGTAARYDIAGERRVATIASGPRAALCAGETGGDGQGTLLRVLQSSFCEHDCAYCPLRRSNDPARAVFEPDELATAFADRWRKGHLDGLMLSSAADGSADRAMQRMIDTASLLRNQHLYDGYIHLKVLPGASTGAIDSAAEVADRLSLNVEVPSPDFLGGLDTGKRWQEDILEPLQYLRQLDREGRIRSGVTSQFLVGVAAPGKESAPDRDLAHGSRWLRREFDLRRVHYSSFAPAPGTPLIDLAAPDPRRRARLYQWDWLAAQYGFADDELDAAFDQAGSLPLALDPKLAVTLARPETPLLEVNKAAYEDLLRVPGIGPVSARRIVDLRHLGVLRDLQDLKALGVVGTRAAPFILLNGKKPPEAGGSLLRIKRKLRALGPQPAQLSFWPELA